MRREQDISVVIPSYNHARYLEMALKSVLGQTVSCNEIIIVDDGSQDESPYICQEMARRYSHIRFIGQDNQGAHNALNLGIREARNDYIGVLNSDDIFLPRKIERCFDLFDRNPGVEFIFGRIGIIDAQGMIQTMGIASDWQERALRFYERSGGLALSLLNENFMATTSNMVFSKRLWNDIGGFQSLRYCHDLDFVMAALLREKAFFDCQEVHIQYRVHPSNTIAEDLSKIKVEIAAIIAVYLCEFKIDLLNPDDNARYQHLHAFLRNKDMSDLIIALMLQYAPSGNRTQFYQGIYTPDAKKQWALFLGSKR